MDFIFLITLTALIIYKLIQTLGKGTNNFKQFKNIEPVIENLKKHTNPTKNAEFEIISLQERKGLKPELRKIFEQLIIEEKDFTIKKFNSGAIKAFKIILKALNNGERDVLQKLLDDNLYKKFILEIENRRNKKLFYNITLVGIKDVIIKDIIIKDSLIFITLEIISEQMIVIKDENSKIISGNQNKILPIYDIWTFKKKIKSNNIWQLTKTNSK